MNKGFIFSMDAMVGGLIILTGLFVMIFFYSNQAPIQRIDHTSEDLLVVLSELKANKVNSSLTTYSNNSVMEQIAEFYVTNEPVKAKQLTNQVLNEANVALFIDGHQITNKSIDANQLVSHKTVLSGFDFNKTLRGFTSRAFISNPDDFSLTKYLYFGGFIGEGNISYLYDLPGDATVKFVKIQGIFGSNFEIIVNGNSLGSFGADDSFEEYNLSSSNFVGGLNKIEFIFEEKSYIGGGFLRADYIQSDFVYQTPNVDKIYLSGIDGFVNIFDSISVPGELLNLTTHIKYYTDFNLYYNIGNVTIHTDNSSSIEQTFTYNNLDSVLDFDLLSNGTVPIRIGIQNISEIIGGNSDVVLITDLSGSMNWRMDGGNNGVVRNCEDSLLTDDSTQRLSLAKCLDHDFIDNILNGTGNRLSLVGFNTRSDIFTGLSNDSILLHNEVDSYSAGGGTCVCCSINRAYEILENSNRNKFIISMTDGITGYRCTNSGSCNSNFEGTSTTGSRCCSGNTGDCSNSACDGAVKNANFSAARAHDDLNATIFAIGFGDLSACYNANQTLSAMAESGNGEVFISSNASELSAIYNTIAGEISSISYDAQQLNQTQSGYSKLDEESYIEITYNTGEPELPYGFIPISLESPRAGNTLTDIGVSIPEGAIPLSAEVTSYSDFYWTNEVSLNGFSVFDLDSYGLDYDYLGDPFNVLLNLNMGNNDINIQTGLKNESFGGNVNNQINYKVGINSVANFTDVLPVAEGCNWNVTFSDGSNKLLQIPNNYAGENSCDYKQAIYNEFDAYDSAAYKLFKQLDLGSNGEVYFNLDSLDISSNTNEVENIPGLLGPLIVEVRSWQ